MSELWLTFCDSLKDAGYSINDLAFCSDDLFLTIAEEIGTFTPDQTALLLSEWHRRLPASDAAGPNASQSPPQPSQRRASSERDPSAGEGTDQGLQKRTYASALSLLEHLSQGSGCTLEVAVPDGLIAIEMSQAARAATDKRIAEMVGPAEPTTILWKLCSPETLSKIQKFCVAGAPCVLSATHDDPDAVCRSALVLYHETTRSMTTPPTATSRGPASGNTSPYAALSREGWALVAFQCAIGKTRTVSASEAANLSGYTTAQCLDMLREAGYDSLTVSGPDGLSAVAVFHPNQMIPCQVVYFTERSQRLDFSSSALDSQQRELSRPSLQRTPRQSGPAGASPDGASANRNGATPHHGQNQTAKSNASVAFAGPQSSCCDAHPQKQVEFWSPSEKRLLCSHCLYYENYSKNNCVPIEAAVRQEAPRLERWIGNAVTFSKEVDTVFELLATASEDIGNADVAFREDVRHQIGRARARLDEIEARLGSESRNVTRQRQQDLRTATDHVEGIVGEVRAIVGEAEVPLRAYRGGVTDFGSAVLLLRAVQRAFGKWEPVPIPSYEVVERMPAFLDGLEAQLRNLPAVKTTGGRVELPEAIDVNFLKETE